MVNTRPPGPRAGPGGEVDRERPRPPRAPRWVAFAEARARLQGLTAVVLDPDVESSGRIFVSLDQVGTHVRLARRFCAGLQLLDEMRPDLLLASPRMADGDVLQLFTGLHAADRCPTLIALAGRTARVDHRRLAQAGCAIVIRKPIDVRLFAQELARQLPAPGGADGDEKKE